MRFDVLKELGLSPVWKRRPLVTDTANVTTTENVTTVANVTTAPPADVATAATTTIAVPVNVERMPWDLLRKTVANCRACDLCQKRTQTVFGIGDTQANIVLVGEGPGFEEDKKGEPFVGVAGKLLDAMLTSIGLERHHNVYITNIVKCRPPNNRNPKPQEARACMGYLRRQLAIIKPQLIVALGAVAAAHLLQSDQPVGKLRQQLHDYEGALLIVTYHPAYLLRAPIEKRKSWEDLQWIRRLMATQNSPPS